MAEPTDPRRPVAQPGAVSRVLTGIAQCLKWIFVSLVFSILIEWIGMLFWWEEQGLAHSRQMLVNELQFLGADFHRSWLTEHPMQFASDLSDRFYYFAFEWTGIVDLIQWITPTPIIEEPAVRSVLHAIYRPVADFVLAGMQITQVFALPLIVTAWVLYLALPVSLHPSWIILPFALVFGFAVTITASTFKKYL